MEEEKPVVHARVANIVGVPSAAPPPIPVTPTPPIVKTLPKQKPLKPTLKHVQITKERGDLTKSGYKYSAMTNLGDKASQFKYDVILKIKGEDKLQKTTNVQTTPEGGISCMVPELVPVALTSSRQESKGAPPKYPITGSKVFLKWEEQQIGEDLYRKGHSGGRILRHPTVAPKPILPTPTPAVTIPVTPSVSKPVATPTPPPPVKRLAVAPPVAPPKEPIWYFDDETLRCKELATGETISKSARRFASRSECIIALQKQIRETRKKVPPKPAAIQKRLKRKIPTRAEELMKKRAFPKAVKEAIEKGLELKEAPRDIERIIEKVAKTNVPDYILRKTIAKRMARSGIVQYKVDTDKGTIVYENADENTVNAILGMPTPTGEVIPLQIKVIR